MRFISGYKLIINLFFFSFSNMMTSTFSIDEEVGLFIDKKKTLVYTIKVLR